MQSFEKWFKVNGKELAIQFAENGADREMDYDFEEECYKEYENWLNKQGFTDWEGNQY